MAIFDLGFNDAAQAAGDFAGAAGDLITAGGYRKERDAYYKARDTSLEAQKVAQGNVGLEQQSTQIKLAGNNISLMQQQREAFKVMGGQRADIASAGLSESGSAMDVIRSSQSQGSLESALIRDQGGLISKQGEINVNAYTQQAISLGAQASAYEGQAHQADATASATDAAAAGKIAAGVVHTGASIVHLLTLGLF